MEGNFFKIVLKNEDIVKKITLQFEIQLHVNYFDEFAHLFFEEVNIQFETLLHLSDSRIVESSSMMYIPIGFVSILQR